MPVETKDRPSLMDIAPLYKVLVKLLLTGQAPNQYLLRFLSGYMSSNGRNVLAKRATRIAITMERIAREVTPYLTPIDASDLKEVSEELNDQYERLASTVALDKHKVVKVLTKTDPKKLSPLLRATMLMFANDLPDVLKSIAGEPVGLKVSLGLVKTILPPGGVIVIGAYEMKNKKMLSVTATGIKNEDIYRMMLNSIAWALALGTKDPREYISKVKSAAAALSSEGLQKLNGKNVLSSSTSKSNLKKFLNKAFPGVPETWTLRMIGAKLLADVALYSYELYSDPVKAFSSYKNEFVLTGLALTAPPLLGNKA